MTTKESQLEEKDSSTVIAISTTDKEEVEKKKVGDPQVNHRKRKPGKNQKSCLEEQVLIDSETEQEQGEDAATRSRGNRSRPYKSRLANGWLKEHSSDFSVINWPPRSPDLNPIEPLWDVLEQGVKDHHTAPTNLIELWTTLDNIQQVIPVELFQKLVESTSRRVEAVIKA
ncbi:transposable element Tcb2 transposase [Trichonephila clavipes]|uniref:Transposable element Tcb2 transposase n=1 Tax=Trichonephila clavipes TaxID=2585209 RepID=A0A8X6R775_TRICX|nr:transposable element Tcb2 transposase [Trichonephila clavipes]